MITQHNFAPEVLANLTASQIDRNARVAKLMLDSASKTAAGNFERSAQIAASLTSEATQAVVEVTEAVAALAQSGLVPLCGASETAKNVKK